ncbi:MAG TPA: hypothetical protein VFY84_10010, partial [Jiangellales bacterium]|nr:hypothetical protein [Jiangellales bacterium]
ALLLDRTAPTWPWRHREAVTFGRYQVVSIAHLDTVRTILRQWPTVTVRRPGPRPRAERAAPPATGYESLTTPDPARSRPTVDVATGDVWPEVTAAVARPAALLGPAAACLALPTGSLPQPSRRTEPGPQPPAQWSSAGG